MTGLILTIRLPPADKMQPDFSTINEDALKLLPVYQKPPTYRIDRCAGSGCFGDPPGYPSYFIQSVYTSSGNSPRSGSTHQTLFGHALPHDWNWKDDKREALLKKLWKPLSINHPRTVAWMKATYKYHQHCYQKDPAAEKWDTIIYPVPDYKLRTFVDDKRFSEEWRTNELRTVEITNREIIDATRKIATPENHEAVILIRRYYPEHEPNLEWIENPPESPGNWWETLPRQPTPEECPGEWAWNGSYNNKHPVNGKWCQVCGRRVAD